jgi:hypothetical protein
MREVSSKLSLGGEVVLRRCDAAWELCKRHERRGRPLALASMMILLESIILSLEPFRIDFAPEETRKRRGKAGLSGTYE